MLLRNHPEVPSWPDHNGIASIGPTPTAAEIANLRVLGIRVAGSGQVAIELSGGAGTWVRDFKDRKVPIAFRDNNDSLIGKTFQEIGDLEV